MHTGPVPDLLENPRSARVKTLAKLARRDARTETGTFLLEGPKAVAEALRWRPELVLELLVTPTALERYGALAAAIDEADVEVDRRILAELAVNEPATFASLVATAKAALPADTSAPKADAAA